MWNAVHSDWRQKHNPEEKIFTLHTTNRLHLHPFCINTPHLPWFYGKPWRGLPLLPDSVSPAFLRVLLCSLPGSCTRFVFLSRSSSTHSHEGTSSGGRVCNWSSLETKHETMVKSQTMPDDSRPVCVAGSEGRFIAQHGREWAADLVWDYLVHISTS